jgi:hypothetical protein
MAERHSALEQFTVPKQGHAPLLKDRATQDAIAMFIQRVDDVEEALAAE